MISLDLIELAILYGLFLAVVLYLASESRRHKWAGVAAALLIVLGAGCSYMAFGGLLYD